LRGAFGFSKRPKKLERPFRISPERFRHSANMFAVMRRRLPPLNALRAFEAVARHMSVTKAADDLSVTPAAVSHHLKSLEDQLRVPLFLRTKNGILLTDAGQAILPGIREGFESFVAAIEQIDNLGDSGVLTVSVAPSFAAKWLLPRLESFQAANPGIDVRVGASMSLTDFHGDGVDLAIRYGAGGYPGLHSDRLLEEAVFPVCSPKLLNGAAPLADIDDLRNHNLLHDDGPDEDPSCPNWAMWLKAAGAEGIDAVRGPKFNQSSLVIEAAVLGRGVALAKASLAAADLDAGRLIKPFGEAIPIDFAYWLVCPEAKLGLRKVELFRDWLKAQAAEFATAN
jgi:LysR family transcriptional regulator, glycine cleavage system transcriptional activator